MHPYLRLDVRIKKAAGSTAQADTPPFPSPLLRRVFGKALIDHFCPFGRPLCEERPPGTSRPSPPQELCHLAETCPYGLLFAASLTARPPYSLYVPASSDGGRGSSQVEITLYGPAWPLYPWVLATLAEAFHSGLGKARQTWTIEEVYRVTPDRRPERLVERDLAGLPPTLQPDLLSLGIEPSLAPEPVVVHLLSPARLVRDGRLLPGHEPVPFDLLIARTLDRFRPLRRAQQRSPPPRVPLRRRGRGRPGPAPCRRDVLARGP